MASKGVKVLITGNVGPNAFQALAAADIKVVVGASGTIRQAVEKYKREELEGTSSPTVRGHFGMGAGRGRGWKANAVGRTENANDEKLEELKRKKLEKLLQESRKEGGEKLKERVVIPAEDGNELNARLSEHFGRAPYFIVVELNEDGSVSNVQAVSNKSEHFGGTGLPPDHILQFKPHAVITYGMGPRALSIFQEKRVAVLKANADTVKEVVEAYKQDILEELTEGCHHARHH
jgi:predicted Fe-Mo cluster-binding NifX family protein